MASKDRIHAKVTEELQWQIIEANTKDINFKKKKGKNKDIAPELSKWSWLDASDDNWLGTSNPGSLFLSQSPDQSNFK